MWVGVLSSCLDVETARDGLFGQRLREVLTKGPRTPELKVRWSPHSRYVRGDDVCDAVLKEWDSDLQSPDFSSRGSAWWMFPNPLYDAGAPERVVEHLLQAARSGTRADERSWFTGRTTEVNRVVHWVRSGQPGIYVISGSAGTGKSAIAGRVVSLSNSHERERLLTDGHNWEHQDPGERSVHAHLHARGLTADHAAAMIADQLVAQGLLEPQAEPRNASELVGQVQRAVGKGKARPVLVVDGLDEARDEAFAIAEELLTRLARHAVIVISTRERRRGDGRPSLIGVLAPSGPGLELDDREAQTRTRADVADYITARLSARDPRMDAGAVAEYLSTEVSMTADRPFLLARLVTDQLRASPVDTSVTGWTEHVRKSVEAAFDGDLAEVDTPPHRHIDRQAAAALARSLLSTLTWGYGGGFPEAEWLAAVNALFPGTSFNRDDLLWILSELGRYIVQDGEAGVAVYRLAHQSLADYLRLPFRPKHDRPFDPHALPLAQALIARYRTLLDGGLTVKAPAYLWRHVWQHVAAAGPEGLATLRNLATTEGKLQLSVAMAATEVVSSLNYWGYRQEALTLTEDVTQIQRDLAAEDPALLPFLGGSLSDLGICYSEMGRLNDALPPSEEAVSILRDLAREEPELLPLLATGLMNLGKVYGGVGRRIDALTVTEEAVTLQRDFARESPVCLPDLAMSLTNLGINYSDVGRLNEALPLAEEAANIFRGVARDNPESLPLLATALNNLSNRYSQVGRLQDAITAAEEAVHLRRDLATSNPAFLPELAMTLNNLANSYSRTGRHRDALALIEESVQYRRDLAITDPAFRPDLAKGLNSLGNHYSDVGRIKEALLLAEEAVQLHRDLVGENPALLPDLAMALVNLGKIYMQAGRHRDAIPPTEEAVSILRDLARDNAAFLHRLAHALNNLSGYHLALRHWSPGASAANNAVHIYEKVVRDNPAALPGFAEALNNLGLYYMQADRSEEALVFFRARRPDIRANRARQPWLSAWPR